MRLNQFLAACGLGSRRNAESLIISGRVAVNGALVHDLATFVEPGKDAVTVDGKRVKPPQGHTYYLLHKPEGVMTTARDPEGRPTVLELVPTRPRVFPVGRLDRDTSGAILLTNDGSLAHRVLHPRYGVEKEYMAVVEGKTDDDALKALRTGLLLPGELRPTAPAQVEVIERRPRRTRLRLVIHEGRKRQVRRMLEAVGHVVLQLRRERIGPVTLGALPPGIYRLLTPEEVAALRRETRGERRKTARRPPPPGEDPHARRDRTPHRPKSTP
jgi:pseudouridine synthase